jgi:hypothetical protein
VGLSILEEATYVVVIKNIRMNFSLIFLRAVDDKKDLKLEYAQCRLQVDE